MKHGKQAEVPPQSESQTNEPDTRDPAISPLRLSSRADLLSIGDIQEHHTDFNYKLFFLTTHVSNQPAKSTLKL